MTASPKRVSLSLPKTIKVGHLKYTVKLMPASRMPEEYGNCDCDAQVITIADPINPERARNTILHEILHAIWDAQNLPEAASEEDVVTEMTNGLVSLFDMNPRFRKWFAQEFCRVKA